LFKSSRLSQIKPFWLPLLLTWTSHFVQKQQIVPNQALLVASAIGATVQNQKTGPMPQKNTFEARAGKPIVSA
jgi:hypothetical protein